MPYWTNTTSSISPLKTLSALTM
ncbi:hypothetical protein E2C01_082465 [Portunus trituberculatus]|uniref:Uncharacterized protein n=1 Tax=Portunus trituberculatus TaxID=210409 RepID=A0A5B7IZ75_PORTR|nr:hypothetical protein [Portunus trituberculatus]